MNLRVIKKDIEYFIGEFIDDCSLFVALNPGQDTDAIANIIDEAVDLYNNLKDKVNRSHQQVSRHTETQGRRKSIFLPAFF